jgi:protein TonB
MTESLAGTRVDAIGALELKRAYQVNLALGLLLAAALHLAAVGSTWFFEEQDVVPPLVGPSAEPDPGRVFVWPDVTIVPDEPKGVGSGSSMVTPVRGIPRPVPDVLVDHEVSISTREDLRRHVQGGRTGVAGGGTDPLQWIVRDTFPAITEVIVGIRYPEAIREVSPIYPLMAERAGLEGRVVVRVLVDASGRVRDAVVVRCSPSGVGFEESARDALMQWVFTPAVQNDHPVAVWVNIPVRFAIR